MPQEAQILTIELKSFPKECEYADLLIDIDDSSELYTAQNAENMRAQTFDTSELADYCEDGFVSYTCHYKYAQKDISIVGGKVFIAEHEATRELMGIHFKAKVALIDKDGHILRVSDAATINGDDCFLYNNHSIEYDYELDFIFAPLFFQPDYSGLLTAFLIIISIVFVMIVFLAVHSFISGLRKADDAQSSEECEETPKSFFKATVILTLLYIITAMLQGVALSKLYMPKNTMESVLLCCAELLPLIIAVVTAVRFKDFFKFIIPDVAFGVVSFQYGDIIMIILVFLFIVVQVFSMFLAVLISNHNQKKKRRKMREKPAR